MSAEENRAIVRRWYEEFGNRANLDVLDELYAPAWIGHFPQTGELRGAEGHKPLGRLFATAFPDGRYVVEDVLAEGDRVVSRYTLRGTHRGAFGAIPPTGRAVTATGINIHRVEGGRIAEQWAQFDALELLRQLGALPASEEASAPCG